MKIYRFVTKDTYESYMLDVASKKLGLNTVVLGGAEGMDDQVSLKTEQINELLKYGAYHLFNSNEEEDEKQEQVMLSEDIDSIIKRSATITYAEGEESSENDEDDDGADKDVGIGKQRARAAAAMKVC